MERRETIICLLLKWLRKNRLTKAHRKTLTEWIKQSPHNRQLFRELANEDSLKEEILRVMRYDMDALWQKVVVAIQPQKPRIYWYHHLTRYAAEIIFPIFVALSMYVSVFTKPSEVTAAISQFTERVDAENILLRLSSGKIVPAKDIAFGDVVRDHNAVITREEDGLRYDALASGMNDNDTQYHSLYTLRGTYPFYVTLPDGSTVWLNAASFIRFPTTFIGPQRKVELMGEAYFEVSKSSNPFVVTIMYNRTSIRDSITATSDQFSIKAFPDEATIKTTILPKLGNVIEQEVMTSTKLSSDQKAAIAWKYGEMYCINNDVYSLLRQLQRYYDVDIEYQGMVKNTVVFANFKRTTPISNLLGFLHRTGAFNFRIDGKRVTIFSSQA